MMTLAAVCCLSTSSAVAATSYTLSGGTLTITGTGAMPNYNPSNPPPWSSNRASITTLVINSGVTGIGDDAFSDCYNLTGALTIPNSVTSIGNYAFYDCGELTLVSIPNSVVAIGANAFAECGIKKLIIEDGDTNLELKNYYEERRGCSYGSSWYRVAEYMSFSGSIDTLYVGRNISIADKPSDGSGYQSPPGCSYDYRFLYAALFGTALKEVTIGNSVTSIIDGAFSDCSGLTTINVDAANTQYSSVDGVLYNKNQSMLMVCPGGKSGALTISNSVTSIRNYAFSGCSGLTSITNLKTAPQSITSDVFYGVTLANLTLYVPFSGASAYHAAAVWKDFGHILNIYTVTFNARGGSNVASQMVTEGNKVTLPTAPTRDGYTFDGWFYELECTNEWFFNSDLPTSDITLYAKWTDTETPSIATLQAQIAALQSEKTALQTQLTTANSTISDVQSDNSTLQSQIAALQSEKTALQTQLATANSTVSDLQSENSTLQSQIATLQAQLDECGGTEVRAVNAIPEVYPNPTTGVVYVNNANGAEIKVHNLNGELLQTTRESRIDLSGEPNGVYLLRVGDKTLKVVKK
ncbi:hypothetical protein AGMMS49982_12860 [Bacteroidia bacterium]|nr:hypothetical protein AGMMS49982_12860 [Bacteroidia bacterium]